MIIPLYFSSRWKTKDAGRAGRSSQMASTRFWDSGTSSEPLDERSLPKVSALARKHIRQQHITYIDPLFLNHVQAEISVGSMPIFVEGSRFLIDTGRINMLQGISGLIFFTLYKNSCQVGTSI